MSRNERNKVDKAGEVDQGVRGGMHGISEGKPHLLGPNNYYCNILLFRVELILAHFPQGP